MVFSSINFIFIFLPVFLLFYWLIPRKYSNAVLFLGSLIFYAYGEHVYFILILVSLAIHYALTRYSAGRSRRCQKVCLFIMLLYGFGTLFIFKYLNFFETNWNHLSAYLSAHGSSISLPVLNLPEISLPIGISFYTFQIAAYAIDVYRGEVEPEKKFVDLGAFLCMFPQLIAGPIVLYSDVAKQLKKRRRSWHHVENGLKTFIIGLSLKVILANTFGILWNQVQTWGVSSVSVPVAWLGILAYTFQIYFDFQGYSLMAMGLGEILGFRIPRNFRHPYTSVTVTEFWRRWHITLSSWFKNYVYIPLGGSRCSKPRMIFNMFVVWAFTGLWHGASWNFVLWGLYYFVLLVFEKIILFPIINAVKRHAARKSIAMEKDHDAHVSVSDFKLADGDEVNTEQNRKEPEKQSRYPVARFFGWCYTFLAVMTGWVLFAITDLSGIKAYLRRLFCYLTQKEAWMMGIDSLQTIARQYWIYFIIGAVCCTAAPFVLYRKNKKRPVAILALLVLFGICVYKLNTSANNPFLYFRF